MRTYKAKSGPFAEQPYYTRREVEQICTDELRNVDLFPSQPEPIRVERFIEKRFNMTPAYEELPEGYLGFTEFSQRGVKKIGISQLLADEGSRVSERRINTTLAHEAGHGLLHAHLFVIGQQPYLLFGEGIEPNKPKILCRSDTIQGLRTYRETGYRCWWEYQANLAIGSLLLPRPLVMIAMEPFLIEEGSMGICRLDSSRQEEAIRTLAQIFDVNPIVARIRVEALFQNSRSDQLTL
jgi:hypothetical protein